jgi:hypothetical protein
LELELKSLNSTRAGLVDITTNAVDVELAIVNVSNIIIFKEKNLSGVFDNGGRIRSEKKLNRTRCVVLREESTRLRVSQMILQGVARDSERRPRAGALRSKQRSSVLFGLSVNKLNIDKIHLEFLLSLDTNQKWRSLASGNQLVRIVHRLDKETVGALELLDDELCELGKVGFAVVTVLLDVRVVNILGKLGNSLGVGLRLKLEALGLKERLDLAVVGNDTIVNHCELIVTIGTLGVAVDGLGLAVGCPARVGNTGMTLKNGLGVDILSGNVFFKKLHLADLLEDKNRSGLIRLANVRKKVITINGKTGRVVAAVLLALEALKERVDNVTACLRNKVIDVAKNAAVRR